MALAVNSYREDEQLMEGTDKKKILRRLFSYLLEYKGILLAVLLCMGITVAISLSESAADRGGDRPLYCGWRSAGAVKAWNICTGFEYYFYHYRQDSDVCDVCCVE